MPRVAHLFICVSLLTGSSLPADEFEFFEKKIRPALVQHCYKCHSGEAKELKGGLRVDSRDAIRRGGESGPAVVPGKPDVSLLLTALAHDDSFVNMPPTGKLPAALIADFRRWIEAGAPDPRDRPGGAKLDWQQVLAGRRGWWSWQAVSKPPLPKVRDTEWSSQPVDRFLQAGWEEGGIEPAPPADRRTLIRRASLLVTGLPPTPAEVEAFVNDQSSRAYENLVDRLLSSPRYGERWARHWMDLVRYGETHGSEHDPLVPHAWRYRDYLIRAFNDDLPYDRFVQEQLAGDLLAPRWNRALGINEALLGTMFFRMVEFYPTPVDCKNEEINVIDSQIDTFAKTFQALTLSCARCHDHKFDAISTQDFYALYGIFASTRTTMHRLDDPDVLHAQDEALAQQLPYVRRAIVELWAAELPRWPSRLAAAVQRLRKSPPVEKFDKATSEVDRDALLLQRASGVMSSPLYPLAQVVSASVSQPAKAIDGAAWRKLADAWRQQQFSPARREHFRLFADFSNGQVGTWYTSEREFKGARPGAMAVAATGDNLLTGIYPGGLYTHLLSDKHGGTLRSPTFTLDTPNISALVCGTNNARLRLVVENFQGDELLFNRSTPRLNDGALQWVTIAVRPQWMGRRAYLEVMPRDEMTYVGKVADASKLPVDGRSGAGIRYVVLHDGVAPKPEATLLESIWDEPPEIEGVLSYLTRDVSTALAAWCENRLDDRQAMLLDALCRAGFLLNSAPAESAAHREWMKYRAIEARVPVPQRAPGVADEDGADERFFVRGDYRQVGELVERRYLEVLHGQPYVTRGSGRLQLAQELTSRDNPLTARVMVNRIWQHVFGAGLVRSVDNFGQLGETPSHPELLDWLSTSFVDQGWSVKRLVRELLLSRAFQLSSQASPQARQRDPDNRLWSHSSLRRIEAEAIRDSLLFVSGRLDETMYGLGVPLPLTKGYKDFDIPASGPLDGHGRRSVYLEARRNYPQALLLAFDQPRPMLTVGRRETTNVPAQSLALLNDPFVRQQAELLAARVLAERHDTSDRRIDSLYHRALGRPPTAQEVERARQFLAEQTATYGNSGASQGEDPRAWQDLAHAIVNLKEFIYLR